MTGQEKIIQIKFRKTLNKCKQVTERIKTLEHIIHDAMACPEKNYDSLRIIDKDIYSQSMGSLEEVLKKFQDLPYPFRFASLRKITFEETYKKIDSICESLRDICLKCGSSSISVLFYILYNKDWHTQFSKEYVEYIVFCDRFIQPFSVELIKNIEKVPELDPKYNEDMGTGIPFARKIFPLITETFIEKVNGTKLFFPLPNKEFIQVNAITKKDPLNLSRTYCLFDPKEKELNKLLLQVDITDHFKRRFMEQFSLRDYMVHTPKEIVTIMKNNHKDLIKYKTMTLSALVKDYVKATKERQRKMLTLFLISGKDDQCLAHIIYDMIEKNDTYTEQPVAEEVFRSMHWSVQKLFKIAFKTIEEKKNRLAHLTDESISYENRIALMDSDENVKNKALDKLKETRGGRESASKAQQYLDGLLKIPFGKYKKEPILSFFSEFQEKMKKSIKQMEDIDNTYFKEISEAYLMIFDSTATPTDQTMFCLIRKLQFIFRKYVESENKKLHTELFEVDDSEEDEDTNLSECSSLHSTPPQYGNSPFGGTSFLTNFGKKRIAKKYKYKNMHLTYDKYTIYDDTYDSIKESLRKAEKLTELLGSLQNGNKEFENIKDCVGIELCIKDCIVAEKEKSTSQVLDSIILLIKDWFKYRQKKREYLSQTRKTLNECVYGHKEAKKQIERLIAQWMNGKMEGAVLGFHGPPGTGKTTLAKRGLAKCLVDENGESRPFAFLPLGGSSSGSILEGHSYTYLGSTWGRIVDILMEKKCMNPIIYIDEVDKISMTERGQEIIGILTHLTDPSQNNEFSDRYFAGIKFDLSKAIIVFSYNDPEKLDRILQDRITEVHVKPLSKNDKLHISRGYLLPEILQSVGYSEKDFIIEQKNIDFIIENYTYEAGVRKLKEKIFEIIREINLQRILGKDITLPFTITQEYIEEVFSDKSKVHVQKIASEPHIGVVNGLYAYKIWNRRFNNH